MGRDVEKFMFEGAALGKSLTVYVLLPGEGIQVSLFGGDMAHTGAVSAAGPDGQQNIEFPGHREGCITEKWASALKAAGFCPAVVTAGIHYNVIDKDGIDAVLKAADGLLSELLNTLKGRHCSGDSKQGI